MASPLNEKLLNVSTDNNITKRLSSKTQVFDRFNHNWAETSADFQTSIN